MKQLATCPACAATMVTEDLGGTRIEVCTGCGGLWFDAGELERLDGPRTGIGPALERALAAPPPAPPAEGAGPPPPGPCPDCPSPGPRLERETHGRDDAVPLDVCPACGGCFLAAGQLARLRAAPVNPERARASIARLRRRRWRRRAQTRRERNRLALLVLYGLGLDHRLDRHPWSR